MGSNLGYLHEGKIVQDLPFLLQFARFLGQVDTNGAPRDTASTADTAVGTELILPRGQFVGHPLAIARLRRTAHAAPMNVGEL